MFVPGSFVVLWLAAWCLLCWWAAIAPSAYGGITDKINATARALTLKVPPATISVSAWRFGNQIRVSYN
jgi:hypothetical protein